MILKQLQDWQSNFLFGGGREGVKAHANGHNKLKHCLAQQCWELLALVAWCMQTNTKPANIVGVKVDILALITALYVSSFSSICLQAFSRFFLK